MHTSPDDPEREAFRKTCRGFLERDVLPFHSQWERDGIVSRDFWRAAGQAGLLAMGAPREFGGAARPEFRYAALLTEELVRARATAPGIVAHNDVVASYLLARTSPEQRERWIPGVVAGELVAAIAGVLDPTPAKGS